MVVLDSNYGMLSNTTNENHYIIPDPATHPPSLDAKNSPLALLAQTCSQIGADSSNAKPLLSSMERAAKKPSSTSSNSSCASSTDRSSSANQQQHQPLPQPARYKSPNATAAAPETKSPESKLAFKPYEPIVLTRKSPPSGGHTIEACEERKSSSSRASSRKSASASPPNVNTTTVSPRDSAAAKLSTSPTAATAATDSSKPQTPLEASTPTPSRTSSVEAHYASLKDSFKPPFSLSPLGPYGCNGCPVPGLDPTNPAFRSPFATGAAGHLPHPHPALLDAAVFQSSTPSPYLSYTRVKTPTGSEAVMPVCKDPYCFSCRFTTLHGVGPCPPGCVQCEPKYNAAAAAAMLMSHPFAGYQYGRPFVCSWVGVGGNEYCGKRFRNSDELLQHLRSHTSTTDPVALMNHLSRYPGSSVNPLAAARYHPYSKAAGLPASLAAPPFSAFNPALAPYYPPYPFYDQRIGAAVNP